MQALLIFIAACAFITAAAVTITACVAVSLVLRLHGVNLKAFEGDVKAMWAERKRPKRAMGV